MATIPSDDRFRIIWKDAEERYRAEVGKPPEDLTRPVSVDGLIDLVKSQHADFLKHREGEKMFHILSMTVLPLQTAMNMASGAASSVFAPSSTIFGAVNYLIGAASGVTEAYDAIIDLFTTLDQFMTRLNIHQRHKEYSAELRNIDTDILGTLLVLIGLSQKVVQHGGKDRFKRYFKDLALGNDKEVQKELDKLKRLTGQEKALIGEHTLEGVYAIQTTQMEHYQEESARSRKIQEALASLQAPKSKEEAKRKQKEVLRSALDPDFFSTNLDQIASRRLPGTGEWVKEDVHFNDWIQRRNQFLWISGGPGVGKSVLSAHIIKYLMERYPQRMEESSRISVSYFFCKNDPPFASILRTLAYLITQNDLVYAKHVEKTLDIIDDIKYSSMQTVWEKLFLDFFKSRSQENWSYIVIDGLDEAFREELVDFLEMMNDSVEEANALEALRIQVLFVSRPDIDLQDQVPQVSRIDMSAKQNSRDIDNYINSKLSRAKKLRKLTKDQQREIAQKLSENADGLFLWVTLMMEEISNKGTLDQIHETLRQPPRGLTATWRHVLERASSVLDPDAIDELNKLLEWIICARRPLHLSDLDSIMQYPTGSGYLDLESDLRTQFASFFLVLRDEDQNTPGSQNLTPPQMDEDDDDFGDDTNTIRADSIQSDAGDKGSEFDDDSQVDQETNSDPNNTTIRLIHLSLGDFFRREAKGGTQVGVSLHEANWRATQACVTLIGDDERYNKWASTNLGTYAAAYFNEHLLEVDPSVVSVPEKLVVVRCLVRMFKEQQVISRWRPIIQHPYIKADWLDTDKYVRCVCKWLSESESRDLMDAESQSWAEQVIHSVPPFANLLKPFAIEIASRWLQTWSDASTELFKLLDAYVEKVETFEHKGSPTTIISNMTEVKPPSSLPMPPKKSWTTDRVIFVARWAQFEENALWHARVAEVLRDTKNTKAAVKSFQRTLELDPDSWLAYNGLAHVYSHLKQYQRAVNVAEKGLSIYQQYTGQTIWYTSSLLNSLATWYQFLGQDDAAIEKWSQSIELTSQDNNNDGYIAFVSSLASLLQTKARYKDMYALFERLHSEIRSNGVSRLTAYVVDQWPDSAQDQIRQAARVQGRQDFAEQALQTAIRAAKASKAIESALKHSLAMQYYQQMNQEERAITLWKRIIRDQSLGSDWYFIKVNAAEQLAQIYFTRALLAKKAGRSFESAAQALEDVAKPRPDVELDMKQYYTSHSTTLLLGSWCRLEGREEEAKPYFREHVMVGHDLLTDNDDSNDVGGFWQLGRALLQAGHDEDATRAFLLIRQQIQFVAERQTKARKTTFDSTVTEAGEESNEAEVTMEMPIRDKTTADHDDAGTTNGGNDEENDNGCLEATVPVKSDDDTQGLDDSDPSYWFCNGRCGNRKLAYGPDHNICRYCLEVDFCDGCLQKLKSGTLGFRICGPEHEFFKAEQPQEELEKGQVRVGEKVMHFSEWVKLLKEEWS